MHDTPTIHLGTEVTNTITLAETVVAALTDQKVHMTTVESCTGGALADFITNVSGSSVIMKDAFVTYSNEAKIALGVPEATIIEHTVYSEETAVAMAKAGLAASAKADMAVGITGSLSRVDPENNNSIPGEVYIGVVFGDVVMSRKILIPAAHRFEAKMAIVRCALHDVLTILH